MANNYTQGTIEPKIPEALLGEERLATLDWLRVSAEYDQGSKSFYLYNDEGIGGETEEGEELDEQDLYLLLQAVIKESKTSLLVEQHINYFIHNQAHYCSKMRPGEFGGSAVFITANKIEYMSTYDWAYAKVNKLRIKMEKQNENQK
jgi:hypothetical protein